VVGVTNALNVVADACGADGAGLATVVAPLDERAAGPPAAAVLADIRAFYELPPGTPVPLPFRLAAHDPGYLADLWGAVRRAFADHRLARRLKEALAFAVSVTTGSAFGAAFHGAELRRLGASDRGVREVLGVTQMFSSYTKIADTLALEPDMADLAPVDPSPAPGGGNRP
jgi:AhpD family alkylhydroperoxidase